jgi:hypothetical protein
MKAIITFAEHSESDRGSSSGDDLSLGIRLLAEGANDRLLLRMLEIRYPSMCRVTNAGSTVSDSRGEPVAVQVPMPKHRDDVDLGLAAGDGANRLDFRLDCPLDCYFFVVSRTHSFRGSVIRRAELWVDDADHWKIRDCRVNGRATPMHDGRPVLGDIPRGALVELDVDRVSAHAVKFCATILGSDPS